MEVKSLLTAISSAKVDDVQAMDRINEAVYCYVKQVEFVKRTYPASDMITFKDKDGVFSAFCPQYHNDRNALKAIRPNGWTLDSIIFYGSRSQNIKFWKAEIHRSGEPSTVLASRGMPTEELAELYCIIAAIQHDRANTEGGQQP